MKVLFIGMGGWLGGRPNAAIRVTHAVVILSGVLLGSACATTKPEPYLLSPDGISVAVTSPPQSKLGVVSTDWNRTGPALEATGKVFGGGPYNPLGIFGLIIGPFALGIDAAQCDQKLQSAYPGISNNFSEIAQREYIPADVQDQFIAVLQEGTPVPIGREDLVLGNGEVPGRQELLDSAARHARAHMFLPAISSVTLQATGKECESWAIRVNMRVQIWKVADRTLVLDFSPGFQSPYVNGPLSDLKSVLDNPGALRSRLKPMYEEAAKMFYYRAMFRFSP